MKLTKSIKYTYKLTEESLEKDINSFIRDARNGKYSWDYKHNGDGIKIVRQYFRLLQEKLDNQEYNECKVCYAKLILFLIDSSIGEEEANFGYEDLLAKVDKDFDRLIKNYFICMIKTCDIEELTERISDYAIKIGRAGYGFDSDSQILINELDNQTLKNLKQKMLIKTEGMTKKEEDTHEIVYFLMDIAREQKNKEEYLRLCERFKEILPKDEFDYLKGEYEDE
jgi:hypothetical protein